MKASFSCPQCGYTQAAPESYIGRRSKCPKCEAVGEITAGRPQPQRQATENAVADSGSKSSEVPRAETPAPIAEGKQGDWPQSDPLAIDTSMKTKPAAARNPVNAFQPSSRSGTAADPERYPNLTLYLKIATTVIKILAILAAGMWCLGGLAACVQTLLDGHASAVIKIATCFATLLMSAFGLLLIYLYYVAVMAIIELVRVVMDIEKNTRRT